MDYAAQQVAPDVVSAKHVAPRRNVDLGYHVSLLCERPLDELLVINPVFRYRYAKLSRRFLHARAYRNRNRIGYLHFQVRVRLERTLDHLAAVQRIQQLLHRDLEAVVLRRIEHILVQRLPGSPVRRVNGSYGFHHRHHQNLHPLQVGLLLERRLDRRRGVELFLRYVHAVLRHSLRDAHLDNLAILPEHDLWQVEYRDYHRVVPCRRQTRVVRYCDPLAVRRYHVGEYGGQDEDSQYRNWNDRPASEEVPDLPKAGSLRADLLRKIGGNVCLCHELSLQLRCA